MHEASSAGPQDMTPPGPGRRREHHLEGTNVGSRGSGFLLNVNLVFAGNVTSAGLSFLIAVLLARALGPEGHGVTSLYQGAVNLGYMLLSMGIASAAVYFVARRDLAPRDLLEAGLSLTLLAAAAAALGVLVAYLLFNDKLVDE